MRWLPKSMERRKKLFIFAFRSTMSRSHRRLWHQRFEIDIADTSTWLRVLNNEQWFFNLCLAVREFDYECNKWYSIKSSFFVKILGMKISRKYVRKMLTKFMRKSNSLCNSDVFMQNFLLLWIEKLLWFATLVNSFNM